MAKKRYGRKKYNYKKLFFAFLILILMVFVIPFSIIKKVKTESVHFENPKIILNREGKQELISIVNAFEKQGTVEGVDSTDKEESKKDAKNSEEKKGEEGLVSVKVLKGSELKGRFIEKYPFTYQKGFFKKAAYELYIPYNQDYVIIKNIEKNTVKILSNIKTQALYFDTIVFSEHISKAFDQAEFILKTRKSANEMEQGDTAYILAKNIKVKNYLKGSSDFTGKLEFFKLNDGTNDTYVAIVPSTYQTEIGEKKLSLSYGNSQMSKDKTFDLTITKRDFTEQYLRIAEDTVKEKRTENARKELSEEMEKVFIKEGYHFEGDMDRFFSGFILPSYGELTTEYGVTRYVNNSLSPYSHIGIDIGAFSGTPILATADGKVVFANELTLTGNTVVISHGFNIYSSYYHLDSLDCKEGDLLKQGDKIGNVGTTGFSTGAHLHFEISYKDFRLEPGFFLYGKPITYENYLGLFKE